MTNKLALVVAVALGILSIVGIRLYVEKIEREWRGTQVRVEVLCATRDLMPGQRWSEDDIIARPFARDFIENAFGDSVSQDRQAIIGNAVANPIRTGQVIQTYHWRSPRQRGLPEFDRQFRAITIPVNRVTGCGGLLRPGDYVDVIVATELTSTVRVPGEPATLKMARTLLRNVLVLATDDITDRFDPRAATGGYNTATLRLSPRDCNKLVYTLVHGGTPHLVIAAEGTREDASFFPVTADSLYREVEAELRARPGG